MHFNSKSIIILILLAVITIPLYSQYSRKKFDVTQGMHVVPMAGVNVFYGDLVDKSRASYTLGVAVEREMKTFLNARAYLMAGQMQGKQLNGNDQVYAYFKNFYTEFSVGATYKPIDHVYGYFRQRSFNPYIIGQIGINYFNATEKYGPGAGEFQPTHPNFGQPRLDQVWHKKAGVTPLFSLGGGLTYYYNSMFLLRAEVLANKPLSDELDGHKEWDDNFGNIYKTDAGDFYYTATLGLDIVIKDSRWKNEPKYTRKAYTKLRKANMTKGNKRKKLPQRPQKRRR
jgi:hypothetical protein